MAQDVAAPSCEAPGGSARCADCTDVACALRALVAGRADTQTAPAPCSHPRPVGWRLRLQLAVEHPQIRHRIPTALVLLTVAGAILGAHGLGALPSLALAVAGLLGVWWSAPRAAPAGWPGITLLAAVIALLAAGAAWAATWPVAAITLGLVTSRLQAGRAAGAWGLSLLAVLAVRMVPALGLTAIPPLGLTVCAAVGLLVGERRAAAERERKLLTAVLEAQSPSPPSDAEGPLEPAGA